MPWHIQNAFEYALELKADTRLDTKGYNVLMYRPGANFNEETMLTHPGSAVQGRVISLCVQAALLRNDDSDALTSNTDVKAVVVVLEDV